MNQARRGASDSAPTRPPHGVRWALPAVRPRRDARWAPRGARKYIAAFRVSVLGQLAYTGELWMRAVFLLMIMFIFSSLWHTTYGEMGRTTLGGFTLTRMLWYLALTESIILSRPRETFRLDEEVRTGAIAYALARPYNYVLYRYAAMLGERLVRIGVNLLVALPLALLFTRGVGLSAAGLLPGLLLLLGAVTIDYLFVVAIQLLAFWAEDTTGLLFIYDRLLMILGGMLLPIGLFPGRLATVARALPFSAIVAGPAQTLVAFDGGAFQGLLARQGAALAVGAALAALVFRLGVRRVAANGG